MAFAATVYLARTLGATLFGTIGFASAVLLYPARIADGGIDAGLGVNEIAADPERIPTLAPSILTARLLVATVLTLLLAVVGLALLPQPDGAVLALYGLTLLTVALSTRWIHLGLERGRLVAVARTVGEVLMVLLVFALVHRAEDLVRAPLAQLVGDSAAALILLLALRRRAISLNVQLHWTVVRPYLPRAVPLVLSALLGLLIFNSDLIFLRGFRGAAAVGYYAAAYALISFLGNMGSTYILSLLPTFTRIGSAGNAQGDLYHTSIAQVFAVTLPAAVGGTLLAPQIIGLVFGSGYDASVRVLQALLWSVPLTTVRSVPTVALMARGREDHVLRTTAWAAAANVLLNVVLIPPFGMIGAALATVTTEWVRLALALAYVRSQGFHLPGVPRLWRAALATLGMAGVLALTRPAHLGVGVGVGAVAYGVGLVLCGGIRVRRGALPQVTL